MPLFGTFSSASSRALGLRNGSPPSPPTITAPTENQSLTGSGNTTNRINTTVTFASTVTSFAIARFEFKVDQLDGSNNIVVAGTYQTAASAGATSFLISNLLTSTKYGLYMRTVDVAGLVSEPTGRRLFTTAAEVAPTAPTPSLSSNALQVGIGYSAGTAGTYAIGTREFALRLASAGATPPTEPAHYVSFTGAVTRSTQTDNGAALVPGTSYRVFFRYTASSPGVGQGTATNTVSTSAEVAPGVPGATLTTTGTTTMTVGRGTSTAGTYPISYYEYRVYQGTTPSGTWISMPNTTAAVTGLAVDTGHRAQVRAVAATSGTSTTSTSATATTDPPTPSAPTIAFSGMSGNSSVTATLTISKPPYAVSAFVNVIGVGTYAATDQGSYFSISLGSQPFNSTIQYRAYVRNRINGDSSYGNTVTWYTPKQNQAYSYTGRAGEWILAATNSVVNPACTSPYASVTWGYVPPSPNDVGYIRIDYVGVQLKSGGFSNTVTNYLFFSTPAGNVSSSLEANTGASFSLRFDSISVGGSSLSGGTIALNYLWSQTNAPTYVSSTQYYTGDKVFYGSQNYQAKSNTQYNVPTNTSFWTAGVTYNPPGSAARLYSGFCVANGTNYFLAKEFYVEGVQTGLGSVS